jgi:hypothetical protein
VPKSQLFLTVSCSSMLSRSSAGGDRDQLVPPRLRFSGGDSEVGGGAGGSGEGKGFGLKSSKEGSNGR